MILSKEITDVFSDDGYGGIVKKELDWIQDCIFERGDLNDAYESIEEHFENSRFHWYPSVGDLVLEKNNYTSIIY